MKLLKLIVPSSSPNTAFRMPLNACALPTEIILLIQDNLGSWKTDYPLRVHIRIYGNLPFCRAIKKRCGQIVSIASNYRAPQLSDYLIQGCHSVIFAQLFPTATRSTQWWSAVHEVARKRLPNGHYHAISSLSPSSSSITSIYNISSIVDLFLLI